MAPIRVLIVDSCMVKRYLLADELARDPMIHVVGNASEIRYALAKIKQYQPDVVVLDVEIPAENGLKMLQEMRKVHPKLPIVMFCTRVKEGTKAAVDALALGATDFAAKPSERDESSSIVGNELLTRIKNLGRRAHGLMSTTGSTGLENGATGWVGVTGKASLATITPVTGKFRAFGITRPTASTRVGKMRSSGRQDPKDATTASGRASLPSENNLDSTSLSLGKPPSFSDAGEISTDDQRKPTNKIEIVAIGVSTGGPKALSALLPRLQKPFPVPIVIVQHMPKQFSELLAQRLAAVSGFKVGEGRRGDIVRPGEIYLAPGGSHMEVLKTADGMRIHVHDGPPENSCRPAVDVLFRSVAKTYGPGALGIILTGMGQDGLGGCRYICDFGGSVLAQDEASSVIWGMPGAVCQAGLADKVLSLEKMPEEINRIITGVSPPRSSTDMTQTSTKDLILKFQ